MSRSDTRPVGPQALQGVRAHNRFSRGSLESTCHRQLHAQLSEPSESCGGWGRHVCSMLSSQRVRRRPAERRGGWHSMPCCQHAKGRGGGVVRCDAGLFRLWQGSGFIRGSNRAEGGCDTNLGGKRRMFSGNRTEFVPDSKMVQLIPDSNGSNWHHHQSLPSFQSLPTTSAKTIPQTSLVTSLQSNPSPRSTTCTLPTYALTAYLPSPLSTLPNPIYLPTPLHLPTPYMHPILPCLPTPYLPKPYIHPTPPTPYLHPDYTPPYTT